MAELSEEEMRAIAQQVVARSMKIGRKPDGGYESVRIVYNRTDESCERFALLVEEVCWRQGALTLLQPYSSVRERLRYTLMPEDSLGELKPLSKAVAENLDVSIFIGEDDDPAWASGLADKLRAAAPVRTKLREILDRRRVRWLYFGWPVPGAAKGYGLPVEEFRAIFFDAIRESFAEETLRLCRFYAKALEGGQEVRIVSDDTDLRFKITGRPVLVDDGIISEEDVARGDVGLNIPSGEVFLAPLEDSAWGHITFEEVVPHGFGKVRGLELRFEGGRVVDYRAEEGVENFRRFLEANTGDKDRIAELGIGCNRGARYTGGSIIIDEKIQGTIHIAIGSNTGAYHGKNVASSHLDMIKDMREGRLYVDEHLVMEEGRPVED
jgi:aminopeptidase